MDGPIPVILDIDVEPDRHTFPIEDPSPRRGFERLMEESPTLRARLSGLTGQPARFTWVLRIDPQIAEGYGDPAWILERHRAFFDRVRELGDAVGVHPHAWRWAAAEGRWVADHGDPDWVHRDVLRGVRCRVRPVAAAPPVREPVRERADARYGRTPGSSDRQTVEPGEPEEGPGLHRGDLWAGVIPDQRRAPTRPYRPDPVDFAAPMADGERPLWELPLSSGRLSLHPRRARRTARAMRHPIRATGALGRGSANRPRAGRGVLAMWRDWRSPRHFWDAAFDSIRDVQRPYLAFAIRSDTPVTPWAAKRFDAIMSALEEDPRAGDLLFTTPEDTLRRLGLEP